MKTATRLIRNAWEGGLADGPGKGSPFDEALEKHWMDAWLLYANNIRFVSAMAGGGDYGVFEDGRYHLAATIAELHGSIEWRKRLQKPAP